MYRYTVSVLYNIYVTWCTVSVLYNIYISWCTGLQYLYYIIYTLAGVQVYSMEQTLKRVGTSHQREKEVLNDKFEQTVKDLEKTRLERESLTHQVCTLVTVW